MATSQSQRIGIGIIAFVMIVGTFGSFWLMATSVQTTADSQAEQLAAYEDYLAKQKDAAKLNASSSEALSGYASRTFNADDVKNLAVEVLIDGSGDVVKATDSINASYFGWTSDGVIFDSSKKKDAEDAPVTFSLNGVITGWTEGLTGVKVGSVVRLTIPADKAYGTSGSGSIAPNSPLEFIVIVQKIDNSTV
jgi:peptidylprolyl isomerase